MRWTAITRICSDPWMNADERRTERKDYKIMKYSYYPGCTLKTKAKIEPESKHLTKRVEEIHEGKYDALIEQIMQKPITEMEELYNTRDIEK